MLTVILLDILSLYIMCNNRTKHSTPYDIRNLKIHVLSGLGKHASKAMLLFLKKEL